MFKRKCDHVNYLPGGAGYEFSVKYNDGATVNFCGDCGSVVDHKVLREIWVLHNRRPWSATYSLINGYFRRYIANYF